MVQKGEPDFPRIAIDIAGYAKKGDRPQRNGDKRNDSDDGPKKRYNNKKGGRNEKRGDREPRGGRESESEARLKQQALDAAKEVRRWGDEVTLPAMNSHDRRIIHITLEGESDILTESIGDGAKKTIKISLKNG
jgi:hypothetical protein